MNRTPNSATTLPGMVRYQVMEISDVYLEATPAMVKFYRRIGWPLEIAGELCLHWGEPCHLCRLAVREAAGTLLIRAVRSEAYRALIRQACRLAA